MRYYVTIADKTVEVAINSDSVTIDGEIVDARLVSVAGTPVRRLSMNGVSHRVVAASGEAKGEWQLHLDGFLIDAQVVDERTKAIRAMTGVSSVVHGPRPVRAPMPGMIVRIEVKPGDKVQAGQPVVIIEAMKMENELRADAAGTVSKVLASAGTAVEKGTVLIEFASDG